MAILDSDPYDDGGANWFTNVSISLGFVCPYWNIQLNAPKE